MSQSPTDNLRSVRPVTDSPPARAAMVSQALRSASRKARGSQRVWVSTAPSRRRWERYWLPSIAASFVVVVIVPAILAALYLAFMASDQYASETRLAVRGGERPQPEMMSALAALAPMARVQDAMIVAEYVQSRGMVEQLQKRIDLRSIYSRDDIDMLSRFDPSEPIEGLVDYWQKRAEVSIDPASGIITVLVRAFTPQDALEVSKGVIAISERLVNDLSERSRNDTLKQARVELDRAQERLQATVVRMRELRNVERILDTEQTAKLMTQMVSDLRLDLIRLEQEYQAQRQTVAAAAPQLRVLDARINSMRAQLNRLQSELTRAERASTPALAEVMSRFDVLELERKVAEEQYIAAAGAYERARIETQGQHVYLATFLPPVMAEEPLFPDRPVVWLIVLAICLGVWGVGIGLAFVVRNYMAI